MYYIYTVKFQFYPEKGGVGGREGGEGLPVQQTWHPLPPFRNFARLQWRKPGPQALHLLLRECQVGAPDQVVHKRENKHPAINGVGLRRDVLVEPARTGIVSYNAGLQTTSTSTGQTA
jgi:hypothetical protein